jgi:hypothetical protein
VRRREYAVRLRVLSEAECYTRCYGGRPGERASVVRIVSRKERRGPDAPKRDQEEKKAA